MFAVVVVFACQSSFAVVTRSTPFAIIKAATVWRKAGKYLNICLLYDMLY